MLNTLGPSMKLCFSTLTVISVVLRKPYNLIIQDINASFWFLSEHKYTSNLYGCDWGCMCLQNNDGCTGTQAPHSDDFITAGRSNESILVIDGHVADLCWVAAECCQEPTIICGPDFHQAVIWTLKNTMRQQINETATLHKTELQPRIRKHLFTYFNPHEKHIAVFQQFA